MTLTDEEIQAFLKELASDLTQFLPQGEDHPPPFMVALAIWPTICRLLDKGEK